MANGKLGVGGGGWMRGRMVVVGRGELGAAREEGRREESRRERHGEHV